MNNPLYLLDLPFMIFFAPSWLVFRRPFHFFTTNLIFSHHEKKHLLFFMVKSKGFPFYFCTFYSRIPLEQIKKNNTISHAMPIRDFTKEIGTWWIKIWIEKKTFYQYHLANRQLFRKNNFLLDEIFQWNASKFPTFFWNIPMTRV